MKWCKNEIIESLLIDKNKIWDYIKEKIAKFSEDTGIERQEAEVLFKEYVNSANLLMQKIKEKLAETLNKHDFKSRVFDDRIELPPSKTLQGSK